MLTTRREFVIPLEERVSECLLRGHARVMVPVEASAEEVEESSIRQEVLRCPSAIRRAVEPVLDIFEMPLPNLSPALKSDLHSGQIKRSPAFCHSNLGNRRDRLGSEMVLSQVFAKVIPSGSKKAHL
jgi:hypothetical protein